MKDDVARGPTSNLNPNFRRASLAVCAWMQLYLRVTAMSFGSSYRRATATRATSGRGLGLWLASPHAE